MRPRSTLAPLALLALLAAAPTLSGCLGDAPEALAGVVPYPDYGDVATYAVTGAYLELGRWENGVPFPSGQGQVRFTIAQSPDALDGTRALHPVFRATAERNSGGGFVKHADHFVSPRHQALVQSYYPLSQDQGIVSFDERGFPWLFGASVLFGAEVGREPEFPFTLWDNLGRGNDIRLAWTLVGTESVDGVDATRLDLTGSTSLGGSVWLAPDDPWPVKARLEVRDDGLAPHVRAQQTPATMEATRVEVTRGDGGSVRPRDRAAGWGEDNAVLREPWDGEKPPDGDPGYQPYLLAQAVQDAKLLDQQLVAWLAQADDPRLYRATYQEDPGPAQDTLVPNWLVQFVDRSETYYEVEVERVTLTPAGQGVPRVTKSGEAEPPADKNHGWFAAADVPDEMVPLSEGVRVIRDVWDAQGVQIFLRSFADPAGYSYFLDGGFEQDRRYTMVYNPVTAFIEHTTGPVSPRLADA